MKSKVPWLLKNLFMLLIIVTIFIFMIFYGEKYFAFQDWDFRFNRGEHFMQWTSPCYVGLFIISVDFLYNLYKHGKNSSKIRNLEEKFLSFEKCLHDIERDLEEIKENLVEIEDNLIENHRVTQEIVLDMFREELNNDKKPIITEKLEMDEKE